MGRHTAGDGAAADPIVEAALRRRPAAQQPGIPRHGHESRQRLLTGADAEGGLGWPAEPHTGTGLGWPVDLGPETAAGHPAVTLVGEAPRVRRRSWWRIFRGAQAAPDDAKRSTAA